MKRLMTAILAASLLLGGAGIVRAQETTPASGISPASTDQQAPAKKKKSHKAKHHKKHKKTQDTQAPTGSN
jgi:hypothetical protein